MEPLPMRPEEVQDHIMEGFSLGSMKVKVEVHLEIHPKISHLIMGVGLHGVTLAQVQTIMAWKVDHQTTLIEQLPQHHSNSLEDSKPIIECSMILLTKIQLDSKHNHSSKEA